jgi:glycosyltransferase involved in cell wall biosynthesis
MISICTSYFNRKPQFIATLDSIALSLYKDIEVIVVDDCSSPEHRLEDLDYPFLRIIRLDEKDWVNPGMSFNIAFKEAKGDKVIIQNPECMHIGDVISYVDTHLKRYNYLAFSCFSWDQSHIEFSRMKGVTNMAGGQGCFGWYNHTQYCFRPYHFCTAVYKENLEKLNGFDERLKDGLCYDDDDLVDRVKLLGLQIIGVDEPCVIHQWHDSSHIYQTDSHEKFLHNQAIYSKIVSGELPRWK